MGHPLNHPAVQTDPSRFVDFPAERFGPGWASRRVFGSSHVYAQFGARLCVVPEVLLQYIGKSYPNQFQQCQTRLLSISYLLLIGTKRDWVERGLVRIALCLVYILLVNPATG